MQVVSIFESQQAIPAKYTCTGENISPPLKFLNVPEEAKSLVLIVDDPDAPRGTFDHWVVWNIPPTVTNLSEGAQELFQNGSKVKLGKNGYGKSAYNGPCPPPGKPHRYFFKLYAIDTMLNLNEGASKHQVEEAMRGHILDQVDLIGTYQR